MSEARVSRGTGLPGTGYLRASPAGYPRFRELEARFREGGEFVECAGPG